MKNIDMESLKQMIPRLQEASSIEVMNKGYSSDLKIRVHMTKMEDLLLRIIDIDQYESKKIEFKHLEVLQQYKVMSPFPIECGALPEFNVCYMILSYIDGEDASEVLPRIHQKDQFRLGIEAGQDLARIHKYRAPRSIASWYERKIVKHQAYVQAYKTCGIKFQYEHQVLDFIEQNIHYMKDRPNLFQHDDFHPGNLIVKGNKYAGVIDFNRYDWGDPIHEFLKVGLFSSEVSVLFCIGQIKGYYGNQIPEHFWPLYTLYMAMAVISSIVWCKRFVPHEMDQMMDRLMRVTEDHKGFEHLKPVWFDHELDY